MKKVNLIAIIIIAFAAFLQPLEMRAAPGGYDMTFGFGGAIEYQIPVDFYVDRIALQQDGKILVAGYRDIGQTYQLILRRHNTNGSLDTTFGYNGEAVEQIAPTIKYINLLYPSNISVQSDGGILIGGNRIANDGSSLGISVWRFTPGGLLDKSFDGDGRKDFTNSPFVIPDPTNYVEKIRITKSSVSGVETENILVLCTYHKFYNYGATGSLAEKSVLFRLNLNGSYDTNFGISGKVTLNGTFFDIANYKPTLSLAGKLIYLAGFDATPTVWRYTNNGLPDTSFGNSGRSSLPSNGSNQAFFDIIVQKDGRVLLSGWANPVSGIIQNYVFRMQTNGTFEQQFGNSVLNGAGAISSPTSYNTDLGLQSDGKFIVGRTYFTKRYFPDGNEDTSYLPSDNVPFFAIQRDNKLVVVETNFSSGVGYTSYTLRRLLPD